jgi:hypothetical protein
MPSFADLAAPPPLERFVNHQIDTRSGWHKGLDNEQEQLAAHRQWGPACSIEHLMKSTPRACLVIASGTQGRCYRTTALR